MTYIKPNYLFAYYTGSQATLTSFTGVLYNSVPVLDGWTHNSGSAYFSFTPSTDGTYQISYSLEVHNNNNASETLTAYVEIDGVPVPGSARSLSLTNSTTNEATLTHILFAQVAGGTTHTLRVCMASSNATRITVANSSNIIAPGLSGNAATLTVTRVI